VSNHVELQDADREYLIIHQQDDKAVIAPMALALIRMDEKKYDIVIVGSGTSAYYCGYALAGAGKKVAIVDERPYGGTCALRGCQPKKYLVANADAIAMAQHLVGQGVESSPTTNWAQLQKLKNEFLDGLSEGSKSGYEKAGIDTYDGHAIMNSENSICCIKSAC